MAELMIGTTPVRYLVLNSDKSAAYGFETKDEAEGMANGQLSATVGADFAVVPEFKTMVPKPRGRKPGSKNATAVKPADTATADNGAAKQGPAATSTKSLADKLPGTKV